MLIVNSRGKARSHAVSGIGNTNRRPRGRADKRPQYSTAPSSGDDLLYRSVAWYDIRANVYYRLPCIKKKGAA
jgi:hypothetical protein